MSGILSSIGDAISGVADAVGSAVSSVVSTVENTVKSAIKDPIGTIAKVAAVATGNAWALPLISGASTIAHGGSIGDALKSAGTAYVAGQVAGVASKGLDSALGTGAAAEGAAANAGTSTLAKIAGNAAGTFVAGGNPLNALISGGIGAGVGELTSQIPGFDSMPAMAQNAIKNAMASNLSSSLLGGQQPTQANVNSALAAGQAAANNGSYTAANNTSGMYQGDPLLIPKLAKVAEEPVPVSGLTSAPGATPPVTAETNSPLSTPMINRLSAPNNMLGGNLGGNPGALASLNTASPSNNVFGIANMNNSGNVYGLNSAQNGQIPMYAKGGLIQHFAQGGDSSTTKDTSSDWLSALKEMGAITGPALSKQAGLMRVGQMGASPYHPDVLPSLADVLRARGIDISHLAHGGQPEHPDDRSHPNYDGSPVFRTGGLEGLGGKYVEGKGDGTSDDISAMLANGEYVFSADVVSALGNGSNKAGAEKLGEMVEAIRSRARSAAPDKLPPDAKSPLEYLKPSRGNKHG